MQGMQMTATIRTFQTEGYVTGIYSRDYSAFIQAVLPPQHDDHVKEYRITRKLAVSREASDSLMDFVKAGGLR